KRSWTSNWPSVPRWMPTSTTRWNAIARCARRKAVEHAGGKPARSMTGRSRPPVVDGVGASRVTIPAGPWTSALDALCALFPAIPAAQCRASFLQARLLDADGKPFPVYAPSRIGMVLFYFQDAPDEPRIVAAVTVLYRDTHLLVADKPQFLPVV